MTRPTLTELRRARDGDPPPINTTEPCRTCADYGPDEIEYQGGVTVGFCRITRERMKQYPSVRPLTVKPTTIGPCWRPVIATPDVVPT